MDTRKHRFMVVAGLVVALAAASAGAQAGPTLKITSPTHGAGVPGDTVTITWESKGVTIVPAADAKAREEAHFHLFVDRADFRPGVEIPRGMEAEGIYHTAKTSHDLKGLKPGKHYVFVVLSYNNHVPWDPFVYDVITFENGAK